MIEVYRIVCADGVVRRPLVVGAAEAMRSAVEAQQSCAGCSREEHAWHRVALQKKAEGIN